MFFNAWAACYREEVQAMVEHPLPVLGFSNSAPFKTSDQSNAMKWLAYMFVYERDGLLHLGRAIPARLVRRRGELRRRGDQHAGREVSVEYQPTAGGGEDRGGDRIRTARKQPERLLVRFRHPEKKPIRSVTVNGAEHQAFDAAKGDVELPVGGGRFVVSVSY